MVRVRQEVHEHLIELVRIGPEPRQVLLEVERKLHVARPELVGEKLDRLFDDCLQPHVASLRHTLTGEREKVANDPDTARCGLIDLLRPTNQCRFLRALTEELSVPRERGERIVELVGDAGEE